MSAKRLVIFTVLFVVLKGGVIGGLKTFYEASCESPGTVLVWVDCDAGLNMVQLSYLDMRIGSRGGRAYGVTFSPNKDYVWFLVETTLDKVAGLASIENVLNVSIAEECGWKWDLWWQYRKIDPVLELQAKRMRAECPDEKIEVGLWFYTTSDREADVNNVRALVESLGGNVTWIGLLESEGVGQVSVSIPLEAINILASYHCIRTLQTIGPLIAG